MPQPIYLPQRQNPFMQLLPMLFQMGMQRQAIAAREDAATKAYHRGLEAQGYQEMDEGLMMTTEGQLQQPGVIKGGRRYGAPQIEQMSIGPEGKHTLVTKGGKTLGILAPQKPSKLEKPTTTTLYNEQGQPNVYELYYKDGRTFLGKRLGLGKPPEGKEGAPVSEKDLLARATTLRGEFTKGSKDFVKVRDAHKRVLASAKNPSAAGDLALIFNYMKILDPGSVVRESEFANAEMSRALLSKKGVPEILLKARDKVIIGARLTPDQRKDFVDRAKKLFAEQRASHMKFRGEYLKKAQQYKVEPEKVLVDYLRDFEVGSRYQDETTGEIKAFGGYDMQGRPIWEKAE
jgi:hypothetical protein